METVLAFLKLLVKSSSPPLAQLTPPFLQQVSGCFDLSLRVSITVLPIAYAIRVGLSLQEMKKKALLLGVSGLLDSHCNIDLGLLVLLCLDRSPSQTRLLLALSDSRLTCIDNYVSHAAMFL